MMIWIMDDLTIRGFQASGCFVCPEAGICLHKLVKAGEVYEIYI